MNETKNVSKRTKNPIFFRKDGGWKSVSTKELKNGTVDDHFVNSLWRQMEIDSMATKEVNQLKAFTTEPHVKQRPAYGRHIVLRPRVASLHRFPTRGCMRRLSLSSTPASDTGSTTSRLRNLTSAIKAGYNL